jgi:hypothetical protein
MSNKLNALNAGQILGRSEMKKIMAGSGGECALYCDGCTIRCGVSPCYVESGAMVCAGQTFTCDNTHC